MLGSVRSVYFPYFIEQQKDGSWMFFNREYGPLGFNSHDIVERDHLPLSMKLSRFTEAKQKVVAFDGENHDGRIYLYNDGCQPEKSKENFDAYMKRLGILIRLKEKTS